MAGAGREGPDISAEVTEEDEYGLFWERPSADHPEAAVGRPVGGPRVRGAAVGFDLVQTLIYEASTKIVVGQERGITQDPNFALGLQQLTQTTAEEVYNHRVAQAIIQQEGLRMTLQDFLEQNRSVERGWLHRIHTLYEYKT